jgi:hypothetical protein
MATVTKDFRVKHGLVVEGTNATVNGSDIITEDAITGGTQTNITVTYNPTTKVVDFVAENGVADSTTDDLVEGEDNLYFTDQRAIDAVGGSATSENDPNTVVKRDANGDFAAGVITADLTGDVTGQVSDISNHSTTDLVEGTNLYYTDVRAVDAVETAATSANTADKIVKRDSSGNFAAEAITAKVLRNNAGGGLFDGSVYLGDNSSFDNYIATHGYVADEIEDHSDLTTGVHGVTGDVVGTTDSQTLSNKTLGTDLNAGTYKVTNLATPTSEADAATKNYVDSAISNLVDGAPALLDTLNELAAALGDDENFATTVATDIGTKVSKAGDSMTGELAMGTNKITGLGTPTSDADAATKLYVDTAETDAVTSANTYTDGRETAITTAYQAYADALETDDVAEGSTNLYFTDVRAVDALEAVVPNFTAVDINNVAKEVAVSGIPTAGSPTAVLSWDSDTFPSLKAIVMFRTSTHTEISEILLTMDSSNNFAITEYAVVGTNGTLGSIAPEYYGTGSGSALKATTINAGTTVTIKATLLNPYTTA